MITLDGNSLTLEDLVKIARDKEEVQIADTAVENVNKSRQIIDDIVSSKRTVYGVNTGFGSLVRVSISAEDTSQLQ